MHSVLGQVKAKLIKHERVTVLSASIPTTKYCPVCGKLKKDITLFDQYMNVYADTVRTGIYMRHGI